MFRLSGVVLHLSQPMFPSRERMKQRRYRKLLFSTSRYQEFPDPDPSSNAEDQLEPLPFVRDITLNKGLFKRLESVSDVGHMIDVTFRVHLADARDEHVFLLGDFQQFGKWRRNNAFPLKWTPGNVWTGQLRLQPGTYEFKIVRVRDGKEDHETVENRVLVIDEGPSAGSDMEITMEFGETRFSNTLKTIRETVVLGAKGDELFRVSGELHRLVEIEDRFGTPTKRELGSPPPAPAVLEETSVEEMPTKSTPFKPEAIEHTPIEISVAEYFESVLRLRKDDIEKVLQKHPYLKFKSVEFEVKPWVEYLRQRVGVSNSRIGSVIKTNSRLLNVSVHNLAPVVEFLLHDLRLPTQLLLQFLRQSRTWQFLKLESKLKPRIENLRQVVGLESSELGAFCVRGIRSLSLDEEELKQRFEDLRATFNFSKEEFVEFVIRYPQLLAIKPRNVAQKLDYMVKELNRSVSEIFEFPVCLEYDLDKRIKERFEYLEQIGIPHSPYSVREIVQPTDEAFKSRFQSRLED